MIVVGIDLGTQSVKALAWRDGEVAGEGAVPVTTARPAADRAEQDPRAWEAAMGAAIAACGVRSGDVGAIGVTGQLDGCVGVDAAGAPLGPCLIWQDQRAGSSHVGPKAAWLAAHGMRAAMWHQPVSYVVSRLTGEHVIDPALAAGMIEPSPRRAAAASLAGTLTRDGAALLGLRAGTPVAVGTGDDFASPIGASLSLADVAVTLGTAEVVGARFAARVVDDGGLVETHPYPLGGWFVENPGWLSGGALRWIQSVVGDAAPAADADGLTFVPALTGAMSPVWRPAARGAFHGLTPRHTAAHLVRAVLEGCAFACRDVVDRLAALGHPAETVVALGGGARHVPAWVQLRASALRRPHVTLGGPDATIYGAIKLAAAAAGLPDPPPLPRAHVFEPGAPLDDDYARYRALVDALLPLWG